MSGIEVHVHDVDCAVPSMPHNGPCVGVADFARAASRDATERAAGAVTVAARLSLEETARRFKLEADRVDPPRDVPHLVAYEVVDGNPMALRLSMPVMCF